MVHGITAHILTPPNYVSSYNWITSWTEFDYGQISIETATHSLEDILLKNVVCYRKDNPAGTQFKSSPSTLGMFFLWTDYHFITM